MLRTENQYQLSVIIPFYNVEFDQIKSAIHSVTEQNEISTEIIIVDDGSQEPISDLVKTFAETIPNARYFKQSNRGVSAARNLGIQVATGEYIAFLDADDRLSEHFFRDIKRTAPMHPDLILGGSKLVRADEVVNSVLSGELLHCIDSKSIHEWKPRLYGKPYYFSKQQKVILNRGIAGKVVRSEIAKKVKMQEHLRLGEDTTYFLEIFNSLTYIIVVNELWYLYTNNSNSATRKYNPDIINQSKASLNSIRNHIDLTNDKEHKAYIERIIWEVRRISNNYINSQKNGMGIGERRKAVNLVYKESPWIYMNRYRFKDWDNLKIVLLYRFKLLFLYWFIKKEGFNCYEENHNWRPIYGKRKQ